MSKRTGKGRRNGVDIALIAIVVILALLVCALAAGVVWLLRQDRSAEPAAIATPASTGALATPEDKLPDNLAVGSAPPDAAFDDGSGGSVPLNMLISPAHAGTWFVFWASWCPDCDEQFEIADQMQALADDYDVELVLIDRLDPEKESVDAARAKLESHGITARCVYDADEVCYRAWGMHEIPSSVILDGGGIVREYRAGVASAGVCEGMLKRAFNGRDSAVLAFIEARMSNEQGGVYTSTGTVGNSPTGEDVLSESQGLMLLYALAKDDRALFARTWAYTRTCLMKNGLAAWYADKGGNPAAVNALLDDLRLWRALSAAGRRWGKPYDELADRTRDAVFNRCVNAQRGLIDYVALDGAERADTIALCYLELKTLSDMGADAKLLNRAREILEGGRISDEFPLYYSSYSYSTGSYSRDPLNTAEALVTLLNLSRAGSLPEDAFAWLKQRVTDADLAARYDISGTPVSGHEYYAPAVYGLAALIAREEGDDALFELSVRRMERGCTMDTGDARYGAYGNRGAAAHAFDQLVALQVNALLSNEGR